MTIQCGISCECGSGEDHKVWGIRATQVWEFTWGFSKFGVLISGMSKGSCGVLHAEIGSLERMRQWDVLRRHTALSTVSRVVKVFPRVISFPVSQKREQKGAYLGGFLWDRPPRQVLLLLTVHWVELSNMAAFNWWEARECSLVLYLERRKKHEFWGVAWHIFYIFKKVKPREIKCLLKVILLRVQLLHTMMCFLLFAS